jgi:hypothetical protein
VYQLSFSLWKLLIILLHLYKRDAFVGAELKLPKSVCPANRSLNPVFVIASTPVLGEKFKLSRERERERERGGEREGEMNDNVARVLIILIFLVIYY